MESLDDIMKQMKREIAVKITSDTENTDSGLEPCVSQQKEDVVYIRNPAGNWGFNRILNFSNHAASALTISM